jgi:acetyl-CoA acyltransferase
MRSAVVVDAVRTPTGRRNGVLSGWHPAELAGEVLAALVARNQLDPGLVDDVIMGCVSQIGAQSGNIARQAVLAGGLPETVPATTVDRQCGSSQQALHFAAQGVMAGAYDVVIAAGVEAMSMVPMGAASGERRFGRVFSSRVRARYADREFAQHRGLLPQGLSAELIAEEWRLSREELDEFGLRSQQLAARARDEGRFDRELLPVPERRLDPQSGQITDGDALVRSDEGIRPTTRQALAALKPSFKEDGRITAGTSSQIADGAAAVLIMSEDRAQTLGLTPLARVVDFALAGVDPVRMLTGPIPATQRVLERCGLALDDIDLVEINEAFASVVLAWQRDLKPDMDRVNVNGGALALGHPLGASGAKLLATLVHELQRRRLRYGLLTMCEGGGLANAMVVERLG